MARARRRWIRDQKLLDPSHLVFIDETGLTTNMVRLWARSPCGVEVVGRVPFKAWKTITFIAALRHNRVVAPMVIDGAMTSERFIAYVEQCLLPTLKPGDVVVLDNLQPHKNPKAKAAIARAGATVRLLPPYSPDLNPIELSFAKAKSFLRKAAKRTPDGLCRAIRSLLPRFTPQECANYLRHAGYRAI